MKAILAWNGDLTGAKLKEIQKSLQSAVSEKKTEEIREEVANDVESLMKDFPRI